MGAFWPISAALLGVVGSCSFDALSSARASVAAAHTPREAAVDPAARAAEITRAKAAATLPLSPPRRTSRRGVPVVLQAEAAPATSTAPAIGYVTIDAYPWSRVSIDATYRGVTPMVRLPLPVGTHVVVLESESGVQHVLSLEVREGETVAERWRWE